MLKKRIDKFHVIIFIKILIIGFLIYQQFFIISLRNEMNSGMNEIRDRVSTVDTRITEVNKERIDSDTKILDVIADLEKTSASQIEDLNMQLKDVKIKSKDFSAIIDDILPSVVGIVAGQSLGSGALLTQDGFIITNYHVVSSGTSNIQVFMSDSSVYSAQLIGYNSPMDVAVLKINGNNFNFLQFTDSKNVNIGEKVIAVGNPYGLSFSVTEGIVSAVNREGPNGLSVYTQTDVPINPGNSGGPLINLNQEIVGINNFKVGEAEGLGFALQADAAKQVAFAIIDEYKSSLA
ncbi:trypsin-like peptidase domain-containing protein [Candidatus Woesearchaeota archaeon]|nr:trypsin-like peptidase domain-containing protein [Candidatus Woesearchaeota archaeon]